MAQLREFTIGVLLLATLISAVDRSNFKTCSQSGFCKRHRDHKPDFPLYRALLNTIEVGSSQLKVQLLNEQNNLKLLLEVFAIKGGIVRVKLNELEPVRPRYEIPIGDCLTKEPELSSFEVANKDSSQVTLNYQGHQVVIQAKPFRIDFISDKEPVVSLNSQGLLKYEHFREVNQAAEDNADDSDDNAVEDEEQEAGEEAAKEEEAKEEEEPDMGEETFKTHKDTKPFGSSSVGMDIAFPGFEHVYGIPEHADDFALKSTKSGDPYRLYNLDVFEYELRNPMALYGSVPMMLAHNVARTVGVFWMNAAETWIDVSSKTADRGMFSKLVDLVKGDEKMPQIDTHWFSESGIIDIFVMLGPSARHVFQQYASLTGTTPLPPLFSLAYHQSRWNYNDEQDVANVDAGFDEHDIPMDVIWLDIEHTDGKRYFTWDAHKFPHSIEMLKNISAKGRKMVNIVDPHMKKDGGYHMNQELQSKGYYIKNKDGNDYEGWCWPGSSYWPDFLNPEIRDFWASKFAVDQYGGTTNDLFIWNDMNEPSVFNGPEITMHKDAKHYGGFEHRDVHNIYGTLVHMATVDGLLKRDEGKQRPFVLSRAFFAGSQRAGAIWTGDNTGEWGHLKITLPMLLSLGVTGMTFSGADVGGFFKNPETELLTRWYQAAVYQPFIRAHAHLDTRRREPWLQPPEHKNAIREALRARYRLLPFWYTLFRQGELDGTPAMRPLWVEFPTVKETFSIEDEYMLGSALLVKPVTDSGVRSTTVYLPGADELWFDRDTWTPFKGGQVHRLSVTMTKIPVFQRGGQIVPQKNRVRRASSLMSHDPYTLIVTLDTTGHAEGELYEDDFISFEYQQGKFSHRKFTFDSNTFTSENLNPTSNSGYTTDAWIERILIVGYQKQPSSATITLKGEQPSPLDFTFDSSIKMLVLRKPGANVDKDFVINIQ